MATAQLSKTWQHDWLSLPWLDLDRQFFKQTQECRDNSALVPIHEKHRNHTLFCDFIARILERRASLHSKQGPASSLNLLERLSLFIPSLDDNQSKLHNLLEFAFSSFKIKELKFSHDCIKPYGFKLPCHVNVHSLKSLWLTGVEVHQSTVDMLALNCPFLEQLKFSLCHIFGMVIEFRGLSKVVTLYLGVTLFLEGQLVINLPCLLSLYYSAGRGDRFDMDVINAQSLRFIGLNDVRVEDGLLDQFLPRLPRLERLSLGPSHYTERLRISNHGLKHLTMELNLHNLLELYIDVPSLENFIYYHTVERVSSQPQTFVTKNFAPKKSIVRLNLKDLKDVKFTEFLQIINEQSKYLELHMEGTELYEMKDDDIYQYGTICGIKHVVLLDGSGFSSPTRQCIGRAARLFPDAVTVVHRR